MSKRPTVPELKAMSPEELGNRLINDTTHGFLYRHEIQRRHSLNGTRNPLEVLYPATPRNPPRVQKTIHGHSCTWPGGCDKKVHRGRHPMCERHWKECSKFDKYKQPMERAKDQWYAEWQRHRKGG